MRRFALALSLAVGSIVVLLPSVALADSCVTCGSGSTNGCEQPMPGGHPDVKPVAWLHHRHGTRLSANVKVR